MSFRTVPARNGLLWITEAVALILKNPVPFVTMGLIYTLITIVPLLGTLALVILAPTLYGGIAWAARVQASGGNADFTHLIQAFQEEGKLAPLLLLCLPGIVIAAVLVVLLSILLAITATSTGLSIATDSPTALIASLGVGGLVLLILVIICMAAAAALVFFAVPDVMFTRNDALAAIRDSLHASVANAGAMLLYLTVMAAMFALELLVIMFSPFSLLLQMLLTVVFVPVTGASMYMAWKDVYGEPAGELQAPAEPPQDGGGLVA